MIREATDRLLFIGMDKALSSILISPNCTLAIRIYAVIIKQLKLHEKNLLPNLLNQLEKTYDALCKEENPTKMLYQSIRGCTDEVNQVVFSEKLFLIGINS